jgi:hypothetical protein
MGLKRIDIREEWKLKLVKYNLSTIRTNINVETD